MKRRRTTSRICLKGVSATHCRTIDLVEAGTIAIGASVDENGDAGEEVATVAITDDDPKAIPHLTGSGSEHFSAAVNDDNDEVSITVKTPLNFEAANRHVLIWYFKTLGTRPRCPSRLRFRSAVVDQNDAPTLAAAYQELEEGEKVIDDQMIVVSGSGSLYTGMYFTDEDGDRLLVDASSSDMTKVAVSTSGLDGVKFSGVAVTEEDAPVTVTLTASDPEGASVDLTFDVHVGENNGPVADADAFAAFAGGQHDQHWRIRRHRAGRSVLRSRWW